MKRRSQAKEKKEATLEGDAAQPESKKAKSEPETTDASIEPAAPALPPISSLAVTGERYSLPAFQRSLRKQYPAAQIKVAMCGKDKEVTVISFANEGMRSTRLVFAPLSADPSSDRGSHICTPGVISFNVGDRGWQTSPLKRGERVFAFVLPARQPKDEWTPQTHRLWPKHFRQSIFAFLLCLKRVSARLPSDLVKMIVAMAAGHAAGYYCVGAGKVCMNFQNYMASLELEAELSIDEVVMLDCKLRRCWKNKFGCYYCFYDKKNQSKFAGYPAIPISAAW